MDKLEVQEIATVSSISNDSFKIRAKYILAKMKEICYEYLKKAEVTLFKVGINLFKAVIILFKVGITLFKIGVTLFKAKVTLVTLFILLLCTLDKFYFLATDLICDSIPYSNSIFPFCKSAIPDFTAFVEAQVEAQEQLLKLSAEFYSDDSLAYDIKMVEMAIKDLIVVVNYSNLKLSSILTEKLKKFAKVCFEANSDLQILQVRTQAFLDNTLIYISSVLYTIELHGEVISPKQGKDLKEYYYILMKLIDKDLQELIYDSDYTLKTLKELGVMQSTIYNIIVQEERLQKIVGQDELLSRLWSILCSNRAEKSIFMRNLKLLENFDTQKTIAVERVALIIEYLIKFQKQLSEEAAAQLLTDIPLEVHKKNIKKVYKKLRAKDNQLEIL